MKDARGAPSSSPSLVFLWQVFYRKWSAVIPSAVPFEFLFPPADDRFRMLRLSTSVSDSAPPKVRERSCNVTLDGWTSRDFASVAMISSLNEDGLAGNARGIDSRINWRYYQSKGIDFRAWAFNRAAPVGANPRLGQIGMDSRARSQENSGSNLHDFSIQKYRKSPIITLLTPPRNHRGKSKQLKTPGNESNFGVILRVLARFFVGSVKASLLNPQIKLRM